MQILSIILYAPRSHPMKAKFTKLSDWSLVTRKWLKTTALAPIKSTVWGVGVLEALGCMSVWGIKNWTWNDTLLSLDRLFCVTVQSRQVLQYCPATRSEIPLLLLGRNMKVERRKSRDVYLQALNSHHHHYHYHHPPSSFNYSIAIFDRQMNLSLLQRLTCLVTMMIILSNLLDRHGWPAWLTWLELVNKFQEHRTLPTFYRPWLC